MIKIFILSFILFVTSCGFFTTEPIILDSITKVVAGNATSFALLEDGSLWGWGSNNRGELGQGFEVFYVLPELQRTHILEDVIFVSSNGWGGASEISSHVLAIKSDNTLWAWGGNERGQTGVGSREHRHTPTHVMDNVVFVSAGGRHSLAILEDGSLWGWGSSEWGEIGVEGFDAILNPIRIMEDVVYVAAGMTHSAAIRSDGSLWVWGDNRMGQIGNGLREDITAPMEVMQDVVMVSLGWAHTLVLTTNGEVWFWGHNGDALYGGVNYPGGALEPIKIAENMKFIESSLLSSFAIDQNNVLWGWGSDTYGQLGLDKGGANHPVSKVMENISYVTAGGGVWYAYTIAIDTNGNVWAWGDNTMGQLGTGNTLPQNTPIRIN